ncbi:MAG TPA: hypothetical protein VMU89_14660 [Thermomicrobiaceae bacterium]|nr:hypothetical protein [Thermomicrobiaceae bacterium]
MTEQPTAPVEPPPPPPEEAVGGIPLATDRQLIARPANVTVPAVTDRSTFGVIQQVSILARMVSGSEFVPKALRNRPAAVAACMFYGHELGVPPMTALQRIYVTEDGDILVSAQLMRALVRAHGHKLWVTEDENERSSTRFRWYGQRSDDQEHVYTVMWTIDMAKTAGLVKDRSAWVKTPRAMLSARASSELCRMMAEDALGGLTYAWEERDSFAAAGDYIAPTDGAEPPETSTQPATRRRSLKVIDAPEGGSEPATAAVATTSDEEVMPDAAVAPTADATPPAPVAATPPARAAASPRRARAVAVSTEPVIPVPGDELGREVVGAGPTPEPSPGAAALTPAPDPLGVAGGGGGDPAAEPLLDIEGDSFLHVLRGKSMAQSVAIAARVAGVNRQDLCKAVSGGRTGSARELNNAEATVAIDHARAIARGEETLLRGEIGERAFPRVGVATLWAETIAALRLLYTHDRATAFGLLDAIDPEWTAKGGLDAYIGTIRDREVIAALRLKARLQLHAIERSTSGSGAPSDPEEEEA